MAYSLFIPKEAIIEVREAFEWYEGKSKVLAMN
ncbi:hypothetical protein MgSA37_03370 [Mucilaginibacter gotjawali]|uniref:Uncharacterized protein n=2 Tax=Mucilaginibacter gotjawali TaxID=1550579 RepID=A0A839SGN2_9SPHI|nr:hypothetical protein [Mucilaginibacter gotjawali]BAU55189.1 hypothetical protein MgSA37_03370 [Mucilaginibacter gotjawali]